MSNWAFRKYAKSQPTKTADQVKSAAAALRSNPREVSSNFRKTIAAIRAKKEA